MDYDGLEFNWTLDDPVNPETEEWIEFSTWLPEGEVTEEERGEMGYWASAGREEGFNRDGQDGTRKEVGMAKRTSSGMVGWWVGGLAVIAALCAGAWLMASCSAVEQPLQPPAATAGLQGHDPYYEGELAKATQLAADAAIRATEVEVARQYAAMTAQFEEDRSVVELRLTEIAGAAGGTQTAIGAVQTEARVTQAWVEQQMRVDEATRQVGLQLTAYWKTETPEAMELEALAVELEAAKAESQAQAGRNTWWAIAGAASILGLAYVAARLAAKWVDWRIEKDRIDVSIVDTRQGPAAQIWDPQLEAYKWHLLALAAGGRFNRDGQGGQDGSLIGARWARRAQGVVSISKNGVTATSSPGVSLEGQAVELVRAAIGVMGEEGVIIPTWRKLDGWTSERWQRAAGYLEQRAMVIMVERVGTKLLGDRNLGDLLWELEGAPTPPQDEGRVNR